MFYIPVWIHYPLRECNPSTMQPWDGLALIVWVLEASEARIPLGFLDGYQTTAAGELGERITGTPTAWVICVHPGK